jgi:hypothetical protein
MIVQDALGHTHSDLPRHRSPDFRFSGEIIQALGVKSKLFRDASTMTVVDWIHAVGDLFRG